MSLLSFIYQSNKPLLRGLLAGFVFLMFAIHDSQAADQKQALEELRLQIGKIQNEMEQNSKSEAAVADALRDSERAISESNRNIFVLAEQQAFTKQNLALLSDNENQLNYRLKGQQDLLAFLLRQHYVGGKHEYLRLLLNNKDPNKISRNLEYYQYIARGRARLLAGIRKDLQELEVNQQQMIEQTQKLQQLQQQQTEQVNILKVEQQNRLQTRARIAEQLQQQQRQIAQMRRDEKRLTTLIQKLNSVVNRTRKPKRVVEVGQSQGVNDVVPDSSTDGQQFAHLKGLLALPVRGEIVNRYGSPRPESTVAWKGLFLKTAVGASVKAVASGRVVFSDWIRGFGNLMVIDHGSGYMSVYGNNETLYKELGEPVKAGDTIAAVGNSGGNEDAGLYFELRYKSEPFDPMSWVKLR